MTVSVDAIRAVRAIVERTIGEVKAALEATGGDVDAAIERLITPAERAANRWAKLLAPVQNARLDDPPPPPRPAASDERDASGVLTDLVTAVRARNFWIGDPDPAGVAALAARFALPSAYVRFLERCNGIDDGVCARLWAADHRRDVLDDYDEPALEDAFAIGEHDGNGYFFLRLEQPGAPVYFFDYSDPPPVTPITRNFESFLRDWLTVDLDLLEVIHNAAARARNR